MSNYKEGDKFIIEIGHGTVDPLYGARYYIKGFNTLVFDDNGLDKLERYDADVKVNADYNAGYEDGLCEAWECAKTIAYYNAGEIYDRFDVRFMAEVLDKFSASEAENRIVEYEAKQNEIKAGDEVEGCFGKWVVFLIDEKNHMAIGLDSNFNYHADKFSDLRRLGEAGHDIKTLVEQMKGADDETD